MSEKLAEEQLEDEEIPLGEGFQCPECDRRFKNARSLGLHRAASHAVIGSDRAKRETAKPRTPRSGSRGAEINRLRRDLKKSASALALLPFMAKGTADRLKNPAVTQTLDEKAEAFADAWVAVAEQSDFVRVNLSRVMAGGVWLNAAAQTAAFGYVLAVFAGYTPLHPGALMLLPEMAQFVYQDTQPHPAAPANGGDKVGAEGA